MREPSLVVLRLHVYVSHLANRQSGAQRSDLGHWDGTVCLDVSGPLRRTWDGQWAELGALFYVLQTVSRPGHLWWRCMRPFRLMFYTGL